MISRPFGKLSREEVKMEEKVKKMREKKEKRKRNNKEKSRYPQSEKLVYCERHVITVGKKENGKQTIAICHKYIGRLFKLGMGRLCL